MELGGENWRRGAGGRGGGEGAGLEGQMKPVDPQACAAPCLCSISYFGLTKYADYRIS